MKKKIFVIIKQFHDNKILMFQEIKTFFRDAKRCFDAPWGFEGSRLKYTYTWHVSWAVAVSKQAMNKVISTTVFNHIIIIINAENKVIITVRDE